MLDKILEELPNRREEVLQRVFERVDIKDLGFKLEGLPSPCFIWTGPDSGTGRGGGYGRMSLNSQTVATHLVVYTHFYGYIPSKKQIDHKCRNRLCCNPAHLEIVSQKENCKRRDKALKEAS